MNQLVTLTIDGREVSVPPGTTVLEAAQKLGIEIPTFCYYVKLSRLGSCRMCLVEIERMRGLQTACTTPVRPEMVVHTNTEAVIKARRANLEFLLTNHPLDCPVCDKGGECQLQDYVFKYGPSVSRYVEEKRHKRKARPLSPFIVYDEERCILCRRCVRFLDEWADDPQLGVFERGCMSYIDTFPGQPLDSKFSGNVVDLCPVGALTSRIFRFRARAWELENVPSVCPYCGVGCNIYLGVKMGQLRRITPRENPNVNEEWLCDKGRFAHQFVESPNRLTTPLVRKNGELTPVSWEEALTTITKRLTAIIEENGADSVGGIGSVKATNEANYLFQRFMRAVVGTNNVDHISRMPEEARLMPSLTEIEEVNAIFLIGVNPSERAPIAELFITEAARRYGAQVIVADPRRIKLARSALWLPCRPGAEVALLNGLARAIIAYKLEGTGHTFEEAEKRGKEAPPSRFEYLALQVREYTPDKVEELTDVPTAALYRATRTLANSWSTLIFYGQALTEGARWAALNNLALLVGGSEPGYMVGDNNAPGALDMGVVPHLYPGRQSVEDERVREQLSQRWRTTLRPDRGLTVKEMMAAAAEGALKALYVMGSNPAAVYPAGEDCLQRLGLLIVQDLFLNETAKLADVVLPAASFAEVDGTYTNMTGLVQRIRPALEPPGQARPDPQIIAALAEAMGQSFSRVLPQAVMDEIAAVAPLYGHISYEVLGENGLRIHLPAPPAWTFMAAPYKPPAANEDYPFILITGRLLYDRGTLLTLSPAVEGFVPRPFVEINAADAQALDIAPGEMVTVSSAAGSMELEARVSQAIRPGCVFVPLHLSETPVESLLGEEAVIWVKISK